MADRVRIAIVGSGPAGLSAAARAAQLGLPQTFLPVVRYKRLVAVLAQVVIEHLGQRPVVFHNENLAFAHG